METVRRLTARHVLDYFADGLHDGLIGSGRRIMNDTATYSGIDLSQFRGYPIDLDVFSGPLDLLLHLVQKDRIEIWEISISRITEQYLAHIRNLEALNVEIAGEFLVMAATLMRTKSQMLLPRPSLSLQDGEEAPLTREGLIQKLLEYRRYREAAASLRRFEDDRMQSLPRGFTPSLEKDHQFPLRPARVIDLATYLRDVLRRDNTTPLHEVQLEEIRLEDQIDHLLYMTTAQRKPLRFDEMIRRPDLRLEWIVTFLAMLELMRQGRIVVLQEEPLGEIWIVGAPPNADPDDERLPDATAMTDASEAVPPENLQGLAGVSGEATEEST
jgi:segregation and condensation protein A